MRKRIILSLILVLAGWAGAATAFDGPTGLPELIHVNPADRSVTFAGTVLAEKWEDRPRRGFSSDEDADPDHWHLVISATQANQAVGRLPLLSAWVTDEAIAEGLADIGAATEKFDRKSFGHRMDPDSPWPDVRPDGTPVRLYVTWKNFFGITRTVEANDFLYNSKGKKLDLVYLGKQHGSDCVVCLYGCVGAVCANRALTVRDYVERGAAWSLRKNVLPDDGTMVWITLKLGEEQS